MAQVGRQCDNWRPRRAGPHGISREDAMPGPQLPPLDVPADARRALEALVRRHLAPQQLVVRARIILLAADGLHNSQIARALRLETDTVRLWRQRWQSFQAVALADLTVEQRLTDAPRSGCPARITPEQ